MKNIWIYVVNHSKGIVIANDEGDAKRKIIKRYFLNGQVLYLEDVQICNAEESEGYLQSGVLEIINLS